MGLVSRAADTFYTFRFLKLLVTPWEKLDAYKYGIVDKQGRNLRPASTLSSTAEKSSYTLFHRLVFNIKRLLNRVPMGKTRIASYAAALYLIKEETGMSDEGLRKIFEKMEVPVDMELQENTWFLNKDGWLQPGVYSLVEDAPLERTREFRARAGSLVEVKTATAPAGNAMGIDVFRVIHKDTNQSVIVSTEDINR